MLLQEEKTTIKHFDYPCILKETSKTLSKNGIRHLIQMLKIK